MKRLLSRILVGIGATTTGVALLALVTPRTTHALVATLVQVTNTSANPVPVTDVGALQPFQADCSGDGVGFDSANCFVTVPTGKRLVLQMVNVVAELDPTNSVVYSTVQVTSQGHSISLYFDLAPTGTSSGGVNFFARGQAVTAYADSGSNVNCAIVDARNSSSSNSLSCSLIGYLVNQ